MYSRCSFGPPGTNSALLNTAWMSSGLTMPIVEVSTISPTTSGHPAPVRPEQRYHPAGGVPPRPGRRVRACHAVYYRIGPTLARGPVHPAGMYTSLAGGAAAGP